MSGIKKKSNISQYNTKQNPGITHEEYVFNLFEKQMNYYFNILLSWQI